MMKSRDAILDVVSKEWPLPAKVIYNRVKKKHKLSLTYQAVFNLLKELVNNGLLVKDDQRYLMNPSYIESQLSFYSEMRNKYVDDGLIRAVKNDEIFTFTSIRETMEFLFKNLQTSYFGESDDLFIEIKRFYIVPLSNSELVMIKEFASKKKIHIFCRGDSWIDRFAAKFLRSLRINVYLNVGWGSPANMVLYGNSVIHIYVLYSPSMGKVVRDQHKLPFGKLNDIFKTYFEAVNKPVKCKVVVNRDSEVLKNILYVIDDYMSELKRK